MSCHFHRVFRELIIPQTFVDIMFSYLFKILAILRSLAAYTLFYLCPSFPSWGSRSNPNHPLLLQYIHSMPHSQSSPHYRYRESAQARQIKAIPFHMPPASLSAGTVGGNPPASAIFFTPCAFAALMVLLTKTLPQTAESLPQYPPNNFRPHHFLFIHIIQNCRFQAAEAEIIAPPPEKHGEFHSIGFPFFAAASIFGPPDSPCQSHAQPIIGLACRIVSRMSHNFILPVIGNINQMGMSARNHQCHIGGTKSLF